MTEVRFVGVEADSFGANLSKDLYIWLKLTAEIVGQAFERDGIDVKLNTTVKRVSRKGKEKVLHVVSDGREETIAVNEILIGAGRAPNVEGLNLEAVTDSEEEGLVKIHVKKGTDQILGGTIVARGAGDMISEITLAMVGKIGLGTIANVIHPYPTRAEAIKQVADAYNRTRLTPFLKALFKKWFAWTR